MTRLLVHGDEVLPRSQRREMLGGKAANLLELRRMPYPIPPFYVVTNDAFRLAIEQAGLHRWIKRQLAAPSVEPHGAQRDTADEISRCIKQIELPHSVADAICRSHGAMFPGGEQFAVRSSVIDEDAGQHSFAGIYDSVLGVRGIENVFDAIKQVWSSTYNHRAVAYRHEHGLSMADVTAAVVVQQMVDGRRSGVMFTCHPVTADPHQIAIDAVLGSGEGLLSGGFPADAYCVDKDTLNFTCRVATKTEKLSLDESAGVGLKCVAVNPGQQRESSLSDEQVREVAQAGLAIERHFGRPVDVEFCFDADEQLFILQSRPITTAQQYGPAAGNHLVWDNSNIIESYSGVTSPMTFSFIRRAYAIVYHCFADVMGISPSVLRANRGTFENMLGLFRGRVYYNLKNWYRAVRLFPGFHYNSQFMEAMMGLKEPLELEDEPPPPGWWRRWFVELPALVRLLVRSTWNFLRIRQIVERFESNFHRHYDRWETLDFEAMAPHELKRLYDEMEETLLWNWKAPIINDFFVMIFYGTLKKLCQSWCADESGALTNDLLCGEGGIESAAPTKTLLRMAGLALADPHLRELILNEPLETIHQTVAGDPRAAEFNELMRRYLDRYGFRCVDELKLEEFSLRDHPHKVYQVIRNYLRLDDPTALDVEAIEARERQVRSDSERRAFAALAKLRSMVPRKTIFRWVLRSARLGVKNRENMRFARARIYGLLREMLRAMGGQFAREAILDSPEDIFYLTLDEVWDYVKGTAVTTDLRGLAQLRREEYQRYQTEAAAPDDRFDTYGLAYHRNDLRSRSADVNRPADGSLQGVGCCAGVVTGPVTVLQRPDEDVNLDGHILVARRTDPGWIPLFPTISGILIQRGSILSHSAVVAREMGIPTIVGITGLVETLTSGQQVRMDGRAGTVQIISSPDLFDNEGAVEECPVACKQPLG